MERTALERLADATREHERVCALHPPGDVQPARDALVACMRKHNAACIDVYGWGLDRGADPADLAACGIDAETKPFLRAGTAKRAARLTASNLCAAAEALARKANFSAPPSPGASHYEVARWAAFMAEWTLAEVPLLFPATESTTLGASGAWQRGASRDPPPALAKAPGGVDSLRVALCAWARARRAQALRGEASKAVSVAEAAVGADAACAPVVAAARTAGGGSGGDAWLAVDVGTPGTLLGVRVSESVTHSRAFTRAEAFAVLQEAWVHATGAGAIGPMHCDPKKTAGALGEVLVEAAKECCVRVRARWVTCTDCAPHHQTP